MEKAQRGERISGKAMGRGWVSVPDGSHFKSVQRI